jgi:hypothetical protein
MHVTSSSGQGEVAEWASPFKNAFTFTVGRYAAPLSSHFLCLFTSYELQVTNCELRYVFRKWGRVYEDIFLARELEKRVLALQLLGVLSTTVPSFKRMLNVCFKASPTKFLLILFPVL